MVEISEKAPGLRRNAMTLTRLTHKAVKHLHCLKTGRDLDLQVVLLGLADRAAD